MNHNDLIARYIYAVTKQLPSKLRTDIEQELSGLIDDMLEERCGGAPVTEHDVRVVLTELGTPSELAAKYDPDSERSLLSPIYYRAYRRVMPIVLACTAGGMALCSVITALLGEYTSLIAHFAEWLGMTWSALLQGFAIVTIVFIILERKGIAPTLDGDSLSSLPPVPKSNERIGVGECIFSIAVSIFFVALVCFAPQCLCFFARIGDGGIMEAVPLFNTEVVRSMWYLWIPIALLGIIDNVVRLVDGAYTRRVAIVTVVTNIISIVLFAFSFLRSDIMNTAFVGDVASLLNTQEQLVISVVARINIVFFCIIAFALVLESISAVVKSRLFPVLKGKRL